MTCPVIKIQNFNYINNFAIIMKVLPNAVQLVNDKPIPLETIKLIPDLDSVTINKVPLTQQDTFFQPIENAQQFSDDLKNQIQSLMDQINTMFKNPNTTPDCKSFTPEEVQQEQTENQITTKIKDLEGNVVKTITTPLLKEALADCSIDGLYHAIESMNIPDNVDPFESKVDDPYQALCELPSDKLKAVLTYTKDQLNQDLDNMASQLDMSEAKQKAQQAADALNIPLPQSEEDYQNFLNSLKQNLPTSESVSQLQFELGIPLICFSAKEKILLQIRNRKLEVINLYDMSKHYLNIDVEIDLGKIFYVIFASNGFQHSLYFFYDDKDTIYSDTLTLPKNMTIEFIGLDPTLQKNFCGLILDIQIITYSQFDINNLLSTLYQFPPPAGALYFYDWHKDRIYKNLVFPLPNLEPPVKMYGMNTIYQLYTDKDPYHFMHDTYLAQFFCWRQLGDSWSFSFWFNVENIASNQNNTGFFDWRTLISDFENDNLLQYDFTMKRFRIKFGDQDQIFNYLIQENLWYFVNFKYNVETNELIFKIRDIEGEVVFQKTYTIKNLKFKLHSMLANFNGTNFENYFHCKFGTLAIFDKSTLDIEDDNLFNTQKIIIKKLNL